MDEDTKTIWIITIVLIIFLITFIRFMAVYADSDYELYCEERFGEEFYYGDTICGDYNKCARECRKVVTNETTGDIELISKYFTRKQIEKDCSYPNFFNFKKWSKECNISNTGE